MKKFSTLKIGTIFWIDDSTGRWIEYKKINTKQAVIIYSYIGAQYNGIIDEINDMQFIETNKK